MSENEQSEPNQFLTNFDGYVLIFCAIILSVLKIIELVLKKKQNNNFNIVSDINKEIESLKNDISTISGIQTSAQSAGVQSTQRKTPETFEVDINESLKRYSKSMSNINTKCQTSTMDNKK